MSYEHYFIADVGGKVVTHKPSNLLITTQQVDGDARPLFSIAIKTSEDKLKRRLNTTAALAECFVCSDNDPAYMKRRAQQEIAAAALAAAGGGDGEDGEGAPAPSRSGKQAPPADYIGSKELFERHPGCGILCLRLRATEGATVPASMQKKGAKGAAAGEPSPQDGGFIFSVVTKGGKSAGRQKQRYILLQRGCIYALLVPPDLIVTKIETRDKHGDSTPVRHWASTHASQLRGAASAAAAMNKLASGAVAAAAAATIAATTAMFSTPFTASQMFSQPIAMTASQLSSIAYTAAAMNLSPFSSSSISPNGGATVARPFVPPSSSAAAMMHDISPVNAANHNGMHPFHPLHNPFPQQLSAHHLQQQQQHQQQQHALFANTMASLTSLPSPTSQMLMQSLRGSSNVIRNPLNAMLPQQHSNQVSPSSMLAMAMGLPSSALSGGMGGGGGGVLNAGFGGMSGGMGNGLPFHPGSNPSSNRSMSGFSNNSGSAGLTPLGSASGSPAVTPGAALVAASSTTGVAQPAAAAGGMMTSPTQAAAAALSNGAGANAASAKTPQQMADEIQQLHALVQFQQAQLQHSQLQMVLPGQLPQARQFNFDSPPGALFAQGKVAVPAIPLQQQPAARSKFDFSLPPVQAQTMQQLPQVQPQPVQQLQTQSQQPPSQISSAAADSSVPSLVSSSVASTLRTLGSSPTISTQHTFSALKEEETLGGGNITPPPFAQSAAAHASLSHSPFAPVRASIRGRRSPMVIKSEREAAAMSSSLGVHAGQGQDNSIGSHMDVAHLSQSESSGALNSAYWNPPPPSSLLHSSTSSHHHHHANPLELPSVSSPDFLASDFPEPGLHGSLDVPGSFFASPLMHESSAAEHSGASSNASHASKSQEHSPANDPMRLHHLHAPSHTAAAAGLSRSSSVDSLRQSSALADALRPPAFPLIGAHSSLMLGDAHPSGSSESGASSSLQHRRAHKRKGPSSNKKRRARGDSSATSSIMSDSEHGAQGNAGLRKGFSLSPRQWVVALKKPPFRSTLSVQRTNADKFKTSDRVQIKFGGEFLDAARIDVYKRQLLIDIPPPPSTVALMHASGVSVNGGGVIDSFHALPRSNIEVDLELHVNGTLKYATTFLYKLGATNSRAATAGDATTSSSSDDDSNSDGRDEEADEAEGADDGGAGGSGPSAPGSPERDEDGGDSNKRHKTDSNGGGGGSGPSNYTYPLHYQAVRLTADFDSIPLFSRGVLKTFPLLSQGLQDLLQTYLLTHVRGSSEREEAAAAAAAAATAAQDALMIAEEGEEGATASSSAPTVTVSEFAVPALPRQRYSAGSRDDHSPLQQHYAASRRFSDERRTAPQTTTNAALTRASFHPRPLTVAQPLHSSSVSRAAARILFVQAVTSQQPVAFVHTALTAAAQAATASASSSTSSLWPHSSINAMDSFGFSLLHYAVAVGSPQLVELMLSLGANPALQARSSHASHAFTPSQLLQLRMVQEQRREERRAARSAARSSLRASSTCSGNLTPPPASLGSLTSSPAKDSDGGARRYRRRSQPDKKRRTTGDGAEDEIANRPARGFSAGSVSNSERDEHHSSSEDSLMADSSSASVIHTSGLASPPLAPNSQPLVLGFSSLHSLGPTPVVSASNSTVSTPTNATARLHLGTSSPVAAAPVPPSTKAPNSVTPGGSKPKSFNFEKPATTAAGEKLLQASTYQLQQQQQQLQHAAMHVYNVQHQLAVPSADKLHATHTVGGSVSTATTAAPTPNSHWGSVHPSPHLGSWHPSLPTPSLGPYSPRASMRSMSPSTSPVPIATSSPVLRSSPPMGVNAANSMPDAGTLNRQMAAVFHAHSLTPQGLALTAAEATRATVQKQEHEQQQSEPSDAALALEKALKHSSSLKALLQHRWKLARSKKEVLVASVAGAGIGAGAGAGAVARSSPLSQNDEERDLQRELVTLELAMLLQHAQMQMTALQIPVPAPASSSASDGASLPLPLQSLHIHALRSMLSQYHLLKAYYLAYKKHQSESAQLSTMVAGIKIGEKEQAAADASEAAAAAASTVMGDCAVADASTTAAAVATDEDIAALLSYVGTLETALRDRVVFMQRTLAPYMQRALLNNKMQRERERAQAKVAAAAAAATAQQQCSGVRPRGNTLMTPPPSASSTTRPLSAGHLSRTNSGLLSLNIVGSIHPDQEDDESAAIRVREIHGVDVLHRDGESGAPRRIDLVVHPALAEQESAAEFVRHSARQAHVRSPTGDVVAQASSRLQTPSDTHRQTNQRRSTGTFVAPHSSPNASVASTPLAQAQRAADSSFSFNTLSAAGTPVTRSPVLSATHTSGNKYALLIALNEYDASLGLPPLRGCENDVSRIGGIISSKYGFAEPRRALDDDAAALFSVHSRSHMLLHAHATRAAFRRALVSLVSAACSPLDSVLIYHAGHGHSSGLMLYDGLFTFAELTHLLEDIATKDCTFVSDTCATDSLPSEHAAPAAAPVVASFPSDEKRNTSLTLEQMRHMVLESESLAAAEILAGISPAMTTRRHTVGGGGSGGDAGSFSTAAVADDAEADVSSDEDMSDAAAAAAPAASSQHRRAASHHHVQYRGLAFTHVEPREPDSSDPLSIPARGDVSEEDDEGETDCDGEPRSRSPCSVVDESPFPVIQRLLARRGVGYFARGLISRKDARAKEVRLKDGSWAGAYTSRLCEKLERFSLTASNGESDNGAVPSSSSSSSSSRNGGRRRTEPANPCVVTLASILFHDEEGGNLSGREFASASASGSSSAAGSRSNSICGLTSILAGAHQADEIDPSPTSGLDLSHLMAGVSIANHEQCVPAPSDSEALSASGEDEQDDNGDADVAACAASLAAVDAADSVPESAAEGDELAQEESFEADVASATDEPCQPRPIALLPVALPVGRAEPQQRHPLLQFFLTLLTLLFSVTRSAPAPERVPVVSVPAAAPKLPSPRLPSCPSSPSLEHQQVAADLLTTEAASSDSSAASDGASSGTDHRSLQQASSDSDDTLTSVHELPAHSKRHATSAPSLIVRSFNRHQA